MDAVLDELSKMDKGIQTQNENYVFGIQIFKLLSLLKNNQIKIPNNLESILLSILESKDTHISPVNASALALCFVYYYQSISKPEFWNFIQVITQKIQKHSLTGIIVIGIMSRYIREGFKSQLPFLIKNILAIHEIYYQPYICKCFRRIIKGTGTFLKSCFNDILSFYQRSASSSNDALRVETIKSIPTLISIAQISFNQISLIISLTLSFQSQSLIYSAAKSFAKITSSPPKDKTNETNPFHFGFSLISHFMQNEKNLKVIASSFYIYFRNFGFSDIKTHLHDIANFVLSFSTFKISLSSMCVLSVSVLSALISVIGTPHEEIFCSYLLESFSSDSSNTGKAVITISCISHSKCSKKTYYLAGKHFFSLLTSSRKDLRKITENLFTKIALNQHDLGIFFLQALYSYITTTNDSSSITVDGIERSICSIILSIYKHNNNINNKNNTSLASAKDLKAQSIIEKLKHFSLEKITKTSNLTSSLTFASLLILSAIHRVFPLTMESISTVFLYIQNFHKFLNNSNDLNNNLRQILKAIESFLSAVIEVQPNDNSLLSKVISEHIKLILSPKISSKLSGVSILSAFSLARRCQNCWEEISELMLKASFINFERFSTDQSSLHANNNEINLMKKLYDVSILNIDEKHIDSSIKSIFHYLIEDSASSFRLMIYKGIQRDFPTWFHIVSLLDKRNNTMKKTQYIQQLFSSKFILLFKHLLSNSSIISSLPNTTIPQLLQLEKRADEKIILSCIARYVKYYPSFINPLLSIFEKRLMEKNLSLDPAYLISELAPFLNNHDLFRAFILLQRSKTNAALSAVFSILSQKPLPEFLYPQLLEFILNICFSSNNGSLLQKSNECFIKLYEHIGESRISNEIFESVLIRHLCVVNHPAYGCILASNLIRNPKTLKYTINDNFKKEMISKYHEIFEKYENLSLPPLSFVAATRITLTEESVPNLFMLLQQTDNHLIIDTILEALTNIPDFKQWIDLSKQIMNQKCVPPVDMKSTKENDYIIPSKLVLLSSIRVIQKLILLIKEQDPLPLSCIDDSVAIAFNAIHFCDPIIDPYAFQVLTSIIRQFQNIRTKEGALIDVYLSQLEASLALIASNSSQSINNNNPPYISYSSHVSEFIINYLTLLSNSHFNLIEEDIRRSLCYLELLSSNNQNQDIKISFIRLCGKILNIIKNSNLQISISESINNKFHNYVDLFFKDVINQKNIQITKLKDQFSDIVSVYKGNKRTILLLILNSLQTKCTEEFLHTLSLLIHTEPKESLCDPILYILEIISKNSIILQIQDVENSRFSLPVILELLEAIASIIPHLDERNTNKWNDIWKYVLLLSLSTKIHFKTFGYLLNSASDNLLHEFLPSIIFSILQKIDFQLDIASQSNIASLINILFSRLSASTADKFIEKIINLNISISLKMLIIHQAAIYFNNYDFQSLKSFSKQLRETNLTEIINFLGVLLSDGHIFWVLYFIHLGVLDHVNKQPFSIQFGIKYLSFLSFLIMKLNKQSLKQNFVDHILKLVFSYAVYASKVKDIDSRTKLLSLCTTVVKNIPTEMTKILWNNIKSDVKTKIIKGFAPPVSLMTPEITLKSFSTNVRKSASNGDWQTLEIDDSSDFNN